MKAQTQTSNDAVSYLPFVRRIAGHIARRLPPSVTVDDLVSAGTIGLLEAMDRYDPSGGRSFETYAEFRVKGAILDELRRRDPLNRAIRAARSRVAETSAQLTSELGRPPETEELATAMKTSLEQYQRRISPLETYRIVPLDAEACPDPEQNQEAAVARQEELGLVRRALEKLNQRQQLVLNLYYVEDLSQSQIGEVLGVTESRVCQILSETVRELRRVLQHAEGAPVGAPSVRQAARRPVMLQATDRNPAGA